jgi:hypothetical protein
MAKASVCTLIACVHVGMKLARALAIARPDFVPCVNSVQPKYLEDAYPRQVAILARRGASVNIDLTQQNAAVPEPKVRDVDLACHTSTDSLAGLQRQLGRWYYGCLQRASQPVWVCVR